MSSQPRALVLNAPGINCSEETATAFEFAGGAAEQVHIKQLESGDIVLDDFQALLLSGGFSYGDHIAAGRLLGLKLRKQFPDDLNRFVEAGKPIVGICNGKQVLVEAGLLPGGKINPERQADMAMVSNERNIFESRWSRLLVERSVCRYIPELMVGQVVELPNAHQEGRIAVRHPDVITQFEANGQVVFRYVGENDQVTTGYPANPNGSPGGITGICDPTGVILGLMPHPERAVRPNHHPNWRRGEGRNPFGLALFKSLVEYSKAA